MSTMMSITRLKTILERQVTPAWGADYQPATRATPQEAPKISRPSIIISSLIPREIHLLSLPERHAALLALYNNRLWDIQEQRMLSTDPRPHSLFGHPIAAGIYLKPFQGTVNVAERLNSLSQHPIVIFKAEPNDPSTWIRVPFPYLGDLLLFLNDDEGPYCVNWTVKKDVNGFKQLHLGRRPNPNRAAANEEKATMRHKIEEIYYQDAEIRTVQVTSSAIPVRVAANLNQLFGWNRRKLKVSESQRSELLSCYQTEMPNGIPPMCLLPLMMQKFGCTREDCLGVLYQSIWRRDLRVDLYQPILVDRPLRPEIKDVLVEYTHWFRR